MTLNIGTPPVAATAAQLTAIRADLGGTQYATLALLATATGKRQALGATVSVKFAPGDTTSIRVKFTDASGAISVSNTTDTLVDIGDATNVQLFVPSGLNFLEYIRDTAEGTDVDFVLSLLV